MVKDGFYKVEFHGTLPGMGGIVMVEQNVIRGADTAFLYAGTLGMASEDRIAATIKVSAYVPAPFPFLALSVFGATPVFTLALTGQLITPDMIELSGSADLSGSPAITVRATKVAALDLS